MINRGMCELVRGPDSCECATDPLHDDYGSDENPAESVAGGNSGKTSRKECFERLQAPLSARQIGGKSCAGDSASTSVQVLRRGQAFGEMALIMNYERTADVRALTYVEMCVLKRSDVQAIFVKHPKDRSDVIKSMLTRVMENSERNQIECPLQKLVSGVFGIGSDSHQADSNQGTILSATHAALLLSAAINMEAADTSIIFGVDESLKQKLVDLKQKDEEADASPSRKVADLNESTGDERMAMRPQRVHSSSKQLTNEMSQRLDDLHRTQQQLLRAMEDLMCDLRAARDYDKQILG